VFWKKRLQTIENKGRECGKERKERYKRLQAAENMGFAAETWRHRSGEVLKGNAGARDAYAAERTRVGVECTGKVSMVTFKA
jgi:hypothetical protein